MLVLATRYCTLQSVQVMSLNCVKLGDLRTRKLMQQMWLSHITHPTLAFCCVIDNAIFIELTLCNVLLHVRLIM